MSDFNFDITYQTSGNNYSYGKSPFRQIQYYLTNRIIGKYSKSIFIDGFINFLTQHINYSDISYDDENNENRFSNLNVKMLYFVYIIKTFEYPDLNENDLIDAEHKTVIKPIFEDILQIKDPENYEDYFLDIIRYLTIFDKIINDDFII
ncbi:hypothetical protein BCR36DRAFT_412903 [Piromyces finnis]|uniref:Uncharacterized protein n=1 Tax=Piromyces finnis TaxID=1754191 RepID=A0A1Y1V8Z2_9FUNG|nr:hypothetical protein BCR36DRAFT_412903 [Piromyces finnis]|eukprot:ORX48892.1 hypothetical protein BCR36DRAFT_412903 [Piromyces finnis]